MSYILDALRKSEAERRQVEAPVLSPGQAEVVELPRRRIGAWVSAAVALVVVAGGTAYWLYGKRGEPDINVRNERVAVASPAALLAGNQAATKGAPDPRPAPEAHRPADAPLEMKQHPLAVAPEVPVRDLTGEARVEAPPPKRSVPPAPSRSGESRAATAAPRDREQVRFLRSMPPDFQRGLPELVVNIHIYAARESERILYINNRQYHAGERVRTDILVEDIVEDGAVLSHRGHRFKLPRPS